MSKKNKTSKNNKDLEQTNSFDCNCHEQEDNGTDSHTECKKGNCSCTKKNSFDSFEAKGE